MASQLKLYRLKMKIHTLLALIYFSLFTLSLFGQTNTLADSTNAVTLFQQAVADYQKSQTHVNAENVIKLAAAMDQLPPIPEEARKHLVIGATLLKDAKTPDDYKQVVDEFKQAIILAPWWPDARYDRALAYEAAGDYTNAMNNFKLYQLFKLSDAESRTVQDKIYSLEAKADEAVKEKESDATKQNEQQIIGLQNNFSELIRKLEGATFVGYDLGHRETVRFTRNPVDLKKSSGNNIVYNTTPYLWEQGHNDQTDTYQFPSVVIPMSNIKFWETSALNPTDINNSDNDANSVTKATLSEDGQTLTERWNGGSDVYTRVQ
jgi:hypothetical protein